MGNAKITSLLPTYVLTANAKRQTALVAPNVPALVNVPGIFATVHLATVAFFV